MALQYIVIGSGPAGISCAKALLAGGASVRMIDGGAQLEDAKTQSLETLRATASHTWDGQSTAWLREGMEAAVEGIPLKLAYGSDFPYRHMRGAPVIQGEAVNTKFSMGKGGLSVVWGSAILPFRQSDLHGWPVSAEELAPHYRAVLDFMPAAQDESDFNDFFPTFKPAQPPMPLSAQAQALLTELEAHRSSLNNQGVRFGRSRLAVESRRCVRCGLCMYGCPYGLIYSSAQTVDDLLHVTGFQYSPGLVAQRIEDGPDTIRIHCINGKGLPETIEGTRAFVGAGVLASTALMLHSLDAWDTPVTLTESHYFLLPMLRLAGVPNFTRGDLHTLAQLFLEVVDPDLSPNTIHLQTYTYNDLFEAPIAQKLGPLSRIFPWKAFLSRLYLFQGYLHSDHSPLTEARLVHQGQSRALVLHATQRPEADLILKKLMRKLGKLRSDTGMLPLSPLLRRGEPGRGFHTGSSFPMSVAPTGLQSDTLGRVGGLRRTHVIDSSVLPSIPATTITYTVMANAHRIGTLVAQGDIH